MPREKREVKRLSFARYEIDIQMLGPLHATSPSSGVGIDYMLARTPSNPVLAARRAVGETITPIDELTVQVSREVGLLPYPEEEKPDTAGDSDGQTAKLEETPSITPQTSQSVFRRDSNGIPFIHPNFIKGSLREAADALGRALGIWAFQSLVNKSVFIRPEHIYLNGNPGVEVETWPTHFDIPRMGRLSGFRQAETVDNAAFSFRVYTTNDPLWTPNLVMDLFSYGAVRGLGGGRGRSMGQYTFTISAPEIVNPDAVWADR